MNKLTIKAALTLCAATFISGCAYHEPNLGYGWRNGVVTAVTDNSTPSRFNYSNELHTNGDQGWEHWEQLGTDSNVGVRYGRDISTSQPLPPQAAGSNGDFQLVINVDDGDSLLVTQRYYPNERFYEGQPVQVFLRGQDYAATGTQQ